MPMRSHWVPAALLVVAMAAVPVPPAHAALLFSDIANSPYQQAIIKVSVTGVMKGNPDGTFKPDQPVTRLEAVEALAAGLNVQGSGSIPNYKDLNEIPENVRPVIAALLNTGAASAQNAQVKVGDITYTLTTDKAVYGVDDAVDLTFTIANTGKTDAVFEFPSTQNYDFIIKRGNDELARWSLGQTFVQSPTSLTLAGGKSFSFTTRWLQKDQDSHTVPPGTYTLSALFPLKDHPVEVDLEFQKGLLPTFPDNTFRPNAQVTRAEFAALLVRAMGLQGEATQKAQAELSIKDAADVPAPLHGYVAAAIDHRIMPVLPDGAWHPTQPTTRGDAAGALAAVMDSLNKFNYVKGTFVSVSGSDVTVSGANKTVTSYALTPAAAIYRNGKPAGPTDLKPNDQVVMLLTGPRGRAGYIEATGQ
jgi:hypothetical protein